MNISTKSVLASVLLTVVIAGTSAQAQGRANNSYDNAQTTPSAEILKVSIQTVAAELDKEINR